MGKLKKNTQYLNSCRYEDTPDAIFHKSYAETNSVPVLTAITLIADIKVE